MTTPAPRATEVYSTVPAHEHAQPKDDSLVQEIAVLLLAGYSISATAKGLAHLLGLPVLPITAALSLAGSGTAHRPNARLKHTPGATSKGVVREVRDNETFFRAAYVLNSSRRIAKSVQDGKTIKQAIEIERPHTRAHEQARRNRLNKAAEMQKLASQFGDLLGWYRDPLSQSETECVDADGHNFYVLEGTVIGYPGAVHPHCHCKAGPPWPDGGMVNDHVNTARKLVPKTFKLKK